MRCVTWNIGVLCVKKLGITVEPAPFTWLRFAKLPEILRELSEADVVFLQEAYGADVRQALHAELKAIWPHAAASAQRAFGLDSGLMTLSRHPLTDVSFTPFMENPWEESVVAHRGVLFSTIHGPSAPVRVMNMHPVAGGIYRHPESSAIDRIRTAQIEQLLAMAEIERVELVAGDLNAGPGVSDANYRQMLSAGWIDSWRELSLSEAPTWDPQNPLNSKGPHRTSPPQRIDHLFHRGTRWRAARGNQVGREARVVTPHGQVTPSDHYGVETIFSNV